jgi:hypothetical protein
MSIPLAEESVYALIKPQQQRKEQQRMYRSKHAASAAVPPSCSTFGFQGTSKICGNVAGKINAAEDPESHPAVKSVGAMGRSVSNEIDPKQFLKRSTATTVRCAGNPSEGGAAGGCRISPKRASRSAPASGESASSPTSNDADALAHASVQSNAAASQQYRINQPVRAPVPTRSERPVMGLASQKNFVAENAREMAQRQPPAQRVEGRAVDLPDFGKVPQYLREIKQGIEAEQTVAKSRAAAVATAVDYDELTAAEAAELRAGLQRRYEDLSRAIKSLPFKLETRSQIRRKEVLEQDFAAVEAAMAKLSRQRILILKQ